VLIEVGDVLAITDVFVITSAGNDRQVRTIVEEIERRAREAGYRPIGVEGLDDATWVLLDFGDVVVHVMSDDRRAYYDLERLWGDMPRLPWRDQAPAARPGPVGASGA
jgi:ribosome-associated protein